MSESRKQQTEPVPLYDAMDDSGRSWLDEVVLAFNEGAYADAVQALLADEALAPGAEQE
jgi:hypothetical protein